MELQPLDSLLLSLLLERDHARVRARGLLRKTRHRARIGEKHEVAARHRHAGAESIKRVGAHAIDVAASSHAQHAKNAFGVVLTIVTVSI